MNKNKRKENNEMIRKIRIISLFIIISIIVIMPKSYAKIEIKPSPEANANKVMVWTTVSNSYLVCQQMKDKGENLYGTSVKPHLSTNKDWGAVSYLSNSSYGTSSAGQNTGVEITMNGVKYYSTNGNSSGVMNWGCNPYKSIVSQTSALIPAYMDLTDTATSTAHDNVKALESDARKNSEYVEVINYNTSPKGSAIKESTIFSFGGGAYDNQVNTPISMREGLFQFAIGRYRGGTAIEFTTNGGEFNKVTFRPVIWNQ